MGFFVVLDGGRRGNTRVRTHVGPRVGHRGLQEVQPGGDLGPRGSAAGAVLRGRHEPPPGELPQYLVELSRVFW